MRTTPRAVVTDSLEPPFGCGGVTAARASKFAIRPLSDASHWGWLPLGEMNARTDFGEMRIVVIAHNLPGPDSRGKGWRSTDKHTKADPH